MESTKQAKTKEKLIYAGGVNGVKNGFKVYCDGHRHESTGIYGEFIDSTPCDCEQQKKWAKSRAKQDRR